MFAFLAFLLSVFLFISISKSNTAKAIAFAVLNKYFLKSVFFLGFVAVARTIVTIVFTSAFVAIFVASAAAF